MCIIYFGIINKPWRPLWTYFSSGGVTARIYFSEDIVKQMSLCPVINTTDTSLWELGRRKLFVCEHPKKYGPESSQPTLTLPEEKASSVMEAASVPVFHFVDVLDLSFLPQPTECPFIIHFPSRTLFYLESNLRQVAKKIIFITLKVSQSGPLSESEIDIVRRVRWHVPLIFPPRSNCVCCLCVLHQQRFSYKLQHIRIELCNKQLLFLSQNWSTVVYFLFSATISFWNHLYLPALALFLTSYPLLLFIYCLLFVSLTQHLCYWSRLWHRSLSVSTEHRISSLSGFRLVFTNTPLLLLDTHAHAHCVYMCAREHTHTHTNVCSLLRLQPPPLTPKRFNFYWLLCLLYSREQGQASSNLTSTPASD